MARSTSTDTRYLEKKDGKYRVTVAVPRGLQAEFGTKLKQPLHTDSLAVANSLKWQVVAELKARLTAAEKRGGRDPLAREALNVAALRSRAQTYDDLANIEAGISVRIDQILGRPDAVEQHPGGIEEEVRDPERERQAKAYADMAMGRSTPIAYHHPEYLKGLTVKPRTRADDERALRYLEDWCSQNRVAPTLQAISTKVAMRFVDGLGSVTKGQSPTTLKKYVNRLRVYWKWLVKREYAEANVWQGVTVEAPDTPHDEEERAFRREEMLTLLKGPASPEMYDLMRIGALTGARLDVIVDLKVQDCSDMIFMFKPQKREKKVRAVPVHSALQEIVTRRTQGRQPEDPLFPEWPAPKANSLRERSFKASNAFTAYRRRVGVDERIPGKRRSLVNFHSFRRWFITEAERADQSGDMIAAVVGHKRSGMTLSRYSAGPLLAQARRCIEAVRLPEAKA